MSAALMAAGGAVANVTVTINGHSVTNSASTTTASAGVKVLRNGQIHTGSNSNGAAPSYSDVGGVEWANNESAQVGDDFEVRFVTVSGTLSSGSADTWQAISTDREYNVQQVGAGTKSFSGTLEIRKGTTVLDSATVTLSAIVDVPV